ncbi:MAG: hypothetical protein DBY17_02150 [Oscillospiraceae bacterium]|nr:MAG: hypothetical protein DBY17_02150 [Oscillospiraceae bacterium]
MCTSGSRSPNSELCGLVQSVREAAGAKGWGIKTPGPILCIGNTPGPPARGAVYQGPSSASPPLRQSILSGLFSQFDYGRALFPRLPP